jgi:(p)ppGpp synthase/HD superfamily hydrolase
MHELDRAIEIALDAHAGQTDKAGESYFLHCNRVAASVRSIDEKVVAYLHDVVGKRGTWSLERLKAEGFSDAIVSAVDALTKRDDENDEVFVRRAASNALARPVKEADLKDNRAQAQAIGLDATKYSSGLDILEVLRDVAAGRTRHC